MQDQYTPRLGQTKDVVVAIRERYAAGEKQRPLAKEYGISQGTVSLIVLGKIWRDAGGPIAEPRRHPDGIEERFWSKVDRGDPEECWNWLGPVNKADGYGFCRPVRGQSRPEAAHRVAYRLLKGEIPEGLELDHLCRNHFCVNPAHLEPVTTRENSLRGVAARKGGRCKHGHELTEDNVIIYRTKCGYETRRCRTCYLAAKRRYGHPERRR